MKPGHVVCTSLEQVLWQPGMPAPHLTSPAILVAQVADFVPHLDYLTSLLSPEEAERAALYRGPAQRQQFLVGRALLRVVLGRFTGTSAARVKYYFRGTTKPYLAPLTNLYFSLSRSAGTVVIALHHQAVGVDVETPVPFFDFAAIVETAFSAAEKAAVAASSTPAALFYQLWTRKEALAKAWGMGITDDFALLPALSGQHCLVVAGRPPDATDWHVASFWLPTNSLGSVAYPLHHEQRIPVLYRLNASTLA